MKAPKARTVESFVRSGRSLFSQVSSLQGRERIQQLKKAHDAFEEAWDSSQFRCAEAFEGLENCHTSVISSLKKGTKLRGKWEAALRELRIDFELTQSPKRYLSDRDPPTTLMSMIHRRLGKSSTGAIEISAGDLICSFSEQTGYSGTRYPPAFVQMLLKRMRDRGIELRCIPRNDRIVFQRT